MSVIGTKEGDGPIRRDNPGKTTPACSPPSRNSSIGDRVWFAPALTAAYALLLAFTLFHHEMWRDELQDWMLARDSTGPLDLLRNMKYESPIPKLWHLSLLLVTRLTSSPAGMQILHWAIASAAIFIVARHAPFGPLQKILFAFGYFPLYEYGVLSRNYALGLLFAVAACALLRRRHRRPLRLALALALMSNTSVHAFILAIGALLALALDYRINRRALAEDDAVDVRKLYAGFAIVAAGILLAALQMILPAGREFPPLHLEWDPTRLAHCLKTIPYVVFFPIDPRFVPMVGITPPPPQAVYGVWTAVALVAAVAAFCRRRTVALLLFLGLVTGFLAFCYTAHHGAFRHWGFLLISLLVLVWSGRYLAGPAAGPGPEARRTVHARRIGSLLLTGFLAMHAVGGLRAVALEVERPFSQAERTAGYIRANGLESLPMIGYPDWSASAVVGHLSPEKRIHYVQGNREGSFVVWDRARAGTRRRPASMARALLSQTRALAARNDGKVLVVLSDELRTPPDERGFRRLESFTGSIIGDENFHLYLYETSPDGDRARE